MTLPAVDPYSFASLSSHWFVYQWLSEIVFALANVFGLAGVSILGVVTLALILCVLVFRRMITLDANSIIACVVIAIVMYGTYPDIAALRPQLFSFALMFILQSILEDVWSGVVARQQLWRVLIKTFVIGVLWVNCHASFPLGVLMLAVYLCGAVVRVVVHKGEDKSRLRILVSMMIVFLGTTLINPDGAGLWIFLKEAGSNNVAHEMQPLDWSRNRLYPIVYCLLLLSTAAAWKSVARPRLVLAVVLFVIGCLHARLIMYFCISACPLIGQGLTALLPNITRWGIMMRLSDSMKVVAFNRFYPVAIMAISIMVVCSQPLYVSRAVPLEAGEYLAAHKPVGNLFCSAHAGSYLIYRFHGSLKVFMDTRVDRYDPALCRAVYLCPHRSWVERAVQRI